MDSQGKLNKNGKEPWDGTEETDGPAILAATMRKLNQRGIKSDVEGSYTGTSRDGEPPVQDADDL